MKITKVQRKNIIKKNAKLESIKPILKKEFLGIDDVIDRVIDSIRPFYIFPESLKRPTIVSLFGLTGTGKTELINMIVKLLDLSYKYYSFDVGEFAGSDSAWKLKNNLSEKITDQSDSNLIFVFDEFQTGRTIDEKGLEVSRISLRPFWQLIDSGTVDIVSEIMQTMYRVFSKLEDCLERGVVVENGIVIEGEVEFKKNNMDYDSRYAPINFSVLGKNAKKVCEFDPGSPHLELSSEMSKPYFITEQHIQLLRKVNPIVFYKKTHEEIRDMFRKNSQDLIDFVFKTFVINSPVEHKKDYSQSLIFVIGNIDEAYSMSHSDNPDDDADIFYENSLKITIPKMKEALSFRFRMEQIGRLGNNIIVYPAFNKNTYKKIIEKNFAQRTIYFKNKFGIDIGFADSLQDVLYKESVFPAQGARPVLSSFNTLIDGFIPKILSDLILKDSKTSSLIWEFDMANSKHIVKDIYSDIILQYPVKLQIENLRKSDNSESQLLTAVHESGHALLSILKLQLIPKEIVSKSAGTAEGFVRLETPVEKTKKFFTEELSFILGGIEAEAAIFGEDNISLGASLDLKQVTELAVSMIKKYGMGNHLYQMEHTPENSKSIAIFSSQLANESEKEAVKLIDIARKETKEIIYKNMEKLIELSKILSIKSKLEYNEIKKIAESWGVPYKNKDDYYGLKQLFVEKELKSKKLSDTFMSHL